MVLDDFFHDFTEDGSQAYRSVVTWIMPVTSLVDGFSDSAIQGIGEYSSVKRGLEDASERK